MVRGAVKRPRGYSTHGLQSEMSPEAILPGGGWVNVSEVKRTAVQAPPDRTGPARTYSAFRWFMLATVTVGYVVAGVFTIVFAPILGLVAREFGVSVGQITILAIASYTFTAAAAIIVSGPVLDRLGIRLPLIAGAVLLVVAMGLVPYLSHTLTGIVILRIVAGLE